MHIFIRKKVIHLNKSYSDVSAFWEDLKEEAAVLYKTIASDPEVLETLSTVVFKIQRPSEHDCWEYIYHRAFIYEASGEMIADEELSQSNKFLEERNRIATIITRTPRLSETESLITDNGLIIYLPYIEGHSWNELLEDRVAILAFFYRQNDGNLVSAIRMLKNRIDDVVKSYKCQGSTPKDYREYLYDLYASEK